VNPLRMLDPWTELWCWRAWRRSRTVFSIPVFPTSEDTPSRKIPWSCFVCMYSVEQSQKKTVRSEIRERYSEF